jgi:ParB family chromosome partitioning protein
MPLFSRPSKGEQPSVLQLPVSVISPNPNQPRRTFSHGTLQEMALSIRELGILQPLTVRREGGGWELVAGERRLRAAMMAGLERVPCIVVEADGSQSTLMALVENIQRQDLDFWEEALALERLMEVCSLSQSEAARKVGLSQSAVANKLRLLKLPAEVLRTLRDGGCTERHARALLRLPEAELQRAAARRVVAKALTVAQTEALVNTILSPPVRARKPICRIKDVRLFLNTIDRGLSIMKAAGIPARCGREESDEEITLTIRIPKHSA